MGGTGGSTRDISRKLSKIRFTQDVIRVEDFLSEDFRHENIVEKVARMSGVSKVQDIESFLSMKNGEGIAMGDRASSPHVELEDIDTVERLVQTCKEIMGRLSELQEDVSQESENLRLALSADHAGCSSRIGKTEVQLNQLEKSLNLLQIQADDLISFGQNVGTPFVEVQEEKEKATKLADLLDHLAIFSHCRDLSMLPASFHSDQDIEKSASIVQALMAAIQSTADIEQYENKQYDHENQIGTLGAAWDQLILYLNVLDNRIVSHFDSAADSKDIAAMAYYKRVMDVAHGDFSNGSLLLISRYISRRSIFSSPDELMGKLDLQEEAGASAPDELATRVHEGFDSNSHVEASRRVTYACNHVLEQIREEVSILEQIFGDDSGKAVCLFVSRVFEETLYDAVHRAFSKTGFGGEHTQVELRESLRLICESYRKVHNLADEACRVISSKAGNDITIQELVDSAMGDIIANYPVLERQWHQTLGTATIHQKANNEILEKDIILDLISMNEESMNRCVQIMPTTKRSSFIKHLFFCGTLPLESDTMMSLLDYVGRYLMEYLQKLEMRSLKELENHTLWKDAVIDTQMVKNTVELSFGAVSYAAFSASEIIKCVKEHYKKDIDPLLLPDENDPWKALLGLQIGIEDHIAIIFQSIVEFLTSKIGELLHATQMKTHFLSDGTNTVEIETPTPPCLKVCAILSEVISRVKAYLISSNYASFVHMLVKSLEDTLEAHFLKFYFTQAGALRLKQDIAAYSLCLGASQVPYSNRAFDDLAAMSNILVVSNLSVHEMVESVLYLGQGRVDRFLQCRLDR